MTDYTPLLEIIGTIGSSGIFLWLLITFRDQWREDLNEVRKQKDEQTKDLIEAYQQVAVSNQQVANAIDNNTKTVDKLVSSVDGTLRNNYKQK